MMANSSFTAKDADRIDASGPAGRNEGGNRSNDRDHERDGQ